MARLHEPHWPPSFGSSMLLLCPWGSEGCVLCSIILAKITDMTTYKLENDAPLKETIRSNFHLQIKWVLADCFFNGIARSWQLNILHSSSTLDVFNIMVETKNWAQEMKSQFLLGIKWTQVGGAKPRSDAYLYFHWLRIIQGSLPRQSGLCVPVNIPHVGIWIKLLYLYRQLCTDHWKVIFIRLTGGWSHCLASLISVWIRGTDKTLQNKFMNPSVVFSQL